MKIITMSKVGYNAPSQANWSYGIWKVDCIDTDNQYCISHTVKESFGGDSRLRSRMSEQHNIHIIETKGIYTSTGTPKITGVSKMQDMESVEFEQELVAFIESK